MSAFEINQMVIHFREGLSLIVETKEMEGTEYFIVLPQHEGGEKIYVPIQRADAVLRPIYDKNDIGELISYMKNIRPEFFSNTKQRRDVFKRKLGSGDIKDLAYLSMLLYFYQNPNVLDVPVKFGPADVDMLKYASRTLFDELALSLDIPRDQIEEHIFKEVRK